MLTEEIYYNLDDTQDEYTTFLSMLSIVGHYITENVQFTGTMLMLKRLK